MWYGHHSSFSAQLALQNYVKTRNGTSNTLSRINLYCSTKIANILERVGDRPTATVDH